MIHQYIMSGLLEGWDWFDISLQNVVKKAGFRPLNKSESMMVLYISAGVVRPADLARKMRMSRPAIRHIEKQLEEKGLITTSADPCDNRSKIIAFADGGLEMRQFGRQTILRLEVALASRIGVANMAALRAALDLDWGDIINDLDVEDPDIDTHVMVQKKN